MCSHAGARCTAYNSTVGGIWSARAGRPGWWRGSGRGEAGERRAVKASKRRRQRPRQRRRRPCAASRLSPHAAGVATARRGAAWPNFARLSGAKPSCRRECACRGRGVPSPKTALGQSQGSAGRLRRSSRASRRLSRVPGATSTRALRGLWPWAPVVRAVISYIHNRGIS